MKEFYLKMDIFAFIFFIFSPTLMLYFLFHSEKLYFSFYQFHFYNRSSII